MTWPATLLPVFAALALWCSVASPLAAAPAATQPGAATSAARSNAIIYAAPPKSEATDLYRVRIDGREVFAYQVRIVSKRSFDRLFPYTHTGFAYWDQRGPVTVEVEYLNGPVSSVKVFPARLNIKPEIEGSIIRFTLEKPEGFNLIVNDDERRALTLLASEPEDAEDVPKRGDKDVIYFGPGTHRADRIELRSGQTLYIAGGAVVHGFIQAGPGQENVKIRGRGVLITQDYEAPRGEHYTWPLRRFNIDFYKCKDIEIGGIIAVDAYAWSTCVEGCENVHIDGLRIINSYRLAPAGIHPRDSKDVLIENCYVRAGDENIDVKAQFHGPAERITVRDSTFWGDRGVGLVIAHYASVFPIRDVLFDNCDVYRRSHSTWMTAAMGAYSKEESEISNVEFRNIRVEGEGGELMVLKKFKHVHSKPAGSIHDIVFRNIEVANRQLQKSYFEGYQSQDAAAPIYNITLDGIFHNGERLDTLEQAKLKLIGPVQNVEFAGSSQRH